MSRFAALVFAVLAVLAGAACDKNSPTQPTEGNKSTTTTPPPPPPSLQSISIEGPASLVPGTHAQYAATGHISDGSTQDLTSTATWRSSDAGVMSIAANGDASGGKPGEVVLAAESSGKRASLQVLVLAPGTFKVSGVVSDSGTPVAGATVDLLDGSRAVMSSRTDADGIYRLYGVSGDIELRVHAPGYPDQVRGFPVTDNRTFDFFLPPGGVLAGSYQLSIDASSCPVAGRNTIPQDLRIRTYDATIAQNGTQLSVKLSGPSLTFGSFTGTQSGTNVTFDIHGFTSGFYYYYYLYLDKTLDLVEQLSPATFLVISGRATVSTSAAGMIGSLDGLMAVVPSITSPYPIPYTACNTRKQFVLTRR